MPGSVTTTKSYDTLGRLDVVTNSGPGAAPGSTVSSFDYTVDDHDRRTRVDLADGGYWEYTYDAAGQLTGGTRTAARLDAQDDTVVQYGYQYDAMGNPMQRTEDAGVSAYTYNNLNQLVTGDWSGTLSAFGHTVTGGLSGVSVDDGQQHAATVFENGTWTTKGLNVPAGDTTLTVTRTAQDQTTVQAQAEVSRPADATQFTHDLNGNMLGLSGWSYSWNDENRLVVAEKAGETRVVNSYDYMGRRRTRQVHSWDAPTQTWQLSSETEFIWDGWLLLSERTTQQPAGSPTVRLYICGLDLSGQLGGEGANAMATAGGIGGILAVTTSASQQLGNAATVLICYDGNGNVANLVDTTTATAVASYEYSPFGKTLVANGPLAEVNPIRFSTKYAESARVAGIPAGPELYYYGSRFYSPELGRWVRRDPVGELGHLRRPRESVGFVTASGETLYTYVADGPVGNVDVLGEITFDSSCASFFSGSVSDEISDAIGGAAAEALTMSTGDSCYYSRLMRDLQLTPQIASCLAGMNSLTVKCAVYIPCSLPPFPTGWGFPGSSSVTVCPGNLPTGEYVQQAIDTIIHEAVHTCYILGHPDVDNPRVWAPLLGGTLVRPRRRADDCCFAFDGG